MISWHCNLLMLLQQLFKLLDALHTYTFYSGCVLVVALELYIGSPNVGWTAKERVKL